MNPSRRLGCAYVGALKGTSFSPGVIVQGPNEFRARNDSRHDCEASGGPVPPVTSQNRSWVRFFDVRYSTPPFSQGLAGFVPKSLVGPVVHGRPSAPPKCRQGTSLGVVFRGRTSSELVRLLRARSFCRAKQRVCKTLHASSNLPAASEADGSGSFSASGASVASPVTRGRPEPKSGGPVLGHGKVDYRDGGRRVAGIDLPAYQVRCACALTLLMAFPSPGRLPLALGADP